MPPISYLSYSLSSIGAGFYLNATQEKWKNWRMYDYVVKELPKLLSENFPQLETSKASIFGHSMGGHGALTIYLKNLDKYKVVGHSYSLNILRFLVP
jgi:S-formylglutathione hydrolase